MTHIAEILPGPLISIAIRPKTKADQEKLNHSLEKLATQDPSFLVNTDLDSGRTIISGMDELHVEKIVDRLLKEFKVNANVGNPQVFYRETIRSSVEQEGKFICQTGGKYQYGHVFLRVEPLKGGKVFDFVDRTTGRAVPRKYIPAVEKGVMEAMQTGVLGGHPMVSVKVTLLGGSYRDVDSSENAFKIAASMAFKDASTRAEPVILEPVMSVEVVAPEEYIGEVIGDLAARRGRIEGIDSRDGARVIDAQVPLAHMLGYATDLRSITQERATYTMEFKMYVEAGPPPDPNGNEPASMAMRVA